MASLDSIRSGDGRTEWRTGWMLAFGAAMGTVVTSIPSNAIGVFVKPLNEAFGWPRAAVSSAILMTAIAVVLLSPFAGRLISRYGPRRVGLVGIVLFSLALAGIGLTGPALWTWFLAWALVSIFNVFAGPIVWSSAVVRHFNVSRGMALAVTLSGTGIGGAIVAPGTLAAMNAFGWRGAFFSLGLAAALFGLPMIYFFFRDPKSTGPLPHSAEAVEARAREDDEAGVSYSLSEAVRTSKFWRLAAAAIGVAMGLAVLLVHFAPILTDAGLTAESAVMIVAVMGPTAIIGRLFGGYLMDRMHAPLLGAIVFALVALACGILLVFNGHVGLAVIVSVLTGLGLGIEIDLLAYLVSRYFGSRAFAAIYGLLLGLYGVGFGAGAILGGAAFDYFGSYDLILQVLIGILLASAIIIGTLGSYPRPREMSLAGGVA